MTFGTGKHFYPGHLLAKAEMEAVIERLVTMNSCEFEFVQPSADERPVNFRHPDVQILYTAKGTAPA